MSLLQHFHRYGNDCYGIDIFYIFFYLNNDYSLKHCNKSDFCLEILFGQDVKTRIFFIKFHYPFFCYGHLTQKKTYIQLKFHSKTVFSFASSVDALQNACIISKQKVSN